MSESHHWNQPGFVLPGDQTSAPGNYPGYPPQSQQIGGYPPNQYSYPQPGPQPGYQPFPPPVQQHHQQPPPHQPPSQQPYPPPIQHQPGNHHSFNQPQNWVNGPFFEYMRRATSFHVKQKVELVEAIIGWETGNKYTVKDQSGNKVFYVGEESNLCFRQCLNQNRPFTLDVKDSSGADVMKMDRPLDCSCFCGLLCPDKMSVATPSGQLLGSIEEEFHILNPAFQLKDASGRTQLRIEGPMCAFSFGGCASDVVFKVINLAGVPVGTISKEWSGFVRELFTDADYFSMSFPVDLDPAMKAVCLGALFLIDYEYFERGTRKKQGGRRLFS